MPLATKELFAISVTERVCSAISLLGTCIIVTTFLASSSFRKPINRLVFYASWGNLMANVATMVSQSGIQAGTNSCLCRFQAFMIQWFMPADALWAFTMACNVYLTFFRKYDSEQLRRLEWKYVVCCYGLPFIPAFTYFFIETKDRGKVYGSAVLWCWVAPQWDFLRIAMFYGPVWLIIILTLVIYVRAGKVIYQKRRQLCDFDGSIDSNFEVGNPFEPSSFTKVTEIQVMTESAIAATRIPNLARDSIGSRLQRPFKTVPYSPYSVSVEAGGAFEKLSGPTTTLKSIKNELLDSAPQRHAMVAEANSAAWAYTKYALLFFIALLVTWAPSTANRVYAWARPDSFDFGLNYVSSFVLPLQGFWNSLIYVSISWPVFKAAISDLRAYCTVPSMDWIKIRLFPSSVISNGSRGSRGAFRSDSTQELTV
ncbi:hypothetical protein SI65_04911 [Aspergillus cristatus]|uniref:G-protein coupled receptors family 2 profile 2 domain-containing protein n=1 Tax=Aspergillus cristatus TaxID=573508 RepID=A0A1E3BG19_ASPCR|nr:hypothetical protein SI65_04911 [Aspergillus cristatus]